ncbi:uncharacterized protein LOC144130454 [Amblyomma americanum]
MRTNMAPAQCLLKITLITFLAVVCADEHPNVPSTEWSRELNSPQTTTNSVTGWMEVNEGRTLSRQGVAPPPFKSRRPTATGTNSGCRKRVACEAARTLTGVIPISSFWQEIVRGAPEPNSAYFAAWSKGLLDKECSELYPDCSDSPAGKVLPLVSEVVGPKGLVTSFLERLTAPSAPYVPRDPGASRPSMVMQKLRWKSKESRKSSEGFTRRHA